MLVGHVVLVALVVLEVILLLLADLLDSEELLLEPELGHLSCLLVAASVTVFRAVVVESEGPMALEECGVR